MAQSMTGKRSHLSGITPAAEKIPAVTSRESPGRKNPTKKPVSTKTIAQMRGAPPERIRDRKSTRLNSSHSQISYAVFCLKNKRNTRSHQLYTNRTTLLLFSEKRFDISLS